MNTLPKDFTLRLTKILSKEEMRSFISAISQEKRNVCCRINTLKSSRNEIEEVFEKTSLKYIKPNFPNNSYIFDSKVLESDLWKLKIYKEGKIYLQNLSSQSPVSYFSKENYTGLKILDACAAPGGKASQLSALYPDAQIYAFEPQKVRYNKMLHNLGKLGCENIEAIHDEIRNIGKYIKEENYFDMILIDAPCSSEGSISLHNTKFLENWDISHINKNYRRQKHIVSDVLPYLKPGGEIIYSTCTISPEENEGIIHYMLCNFPELSLEKIDILENKYIKTIKPLKNFESKVFKTEISEKTIRVIPSKYSEGFFIAKLTKNELNLTQ